jgi:hypothetical protein
MLLLLTSVGADCGLILQCCGTHKERPLLYLLLPWSGCELCYCLWLFCFPPPSVKTYARYSKRTVLFFSCQPWPNLYWLSRQLKTTVSLVPELLMAKSRTLHLLARMYQWFWEGTPLYASLPGCHQFTGYVDPCFYIDGHRDSSQ